ncbi:MAG: hypothetical protein RL173_253 [Fibrobacterota bacterium]|jgi:spermidine synthase
MMRSASGGQRIALLVSVFVVASCGLAYELVAGALSSYLLGDSVTQFSTVIGTYLFAMGIGSWASKHVEGRIADRFVSIEVAIGILGGFTAPFLFWVFSQPGAPFHVCLYLCVMLVGFLVGLEIPLVMRLLERESSFKDLVSQVLSLDYLGSLAVSVLFPLVLAPRLGFVRTGLLFGIFNALVALWAARVFKDRLTSPRSTFAQAFAAIGLLVGGMVFAGDWTNYVESRFYDEEIVHSSSSPYQRVVVTRWRSDVRLYLNGNLQFSSRDEYRYHEALVHPVLSSHPRPSRVLVLGGGDGLAVREILKHPQVRQVTLVDLDPTMTSLFKTHPLLVSLNQGSLANQKVTVVNADAFKWLEDHPDAFDVAIVDFPDPSNYAVGKLYTTTFYRLLERHLAPGGMAAIQTTSPLIARRSFWTVVNTLESVNLHTAPYHALVPSFGEWGFVIATRDTWKAPDTIALATRFVTARSLSTMRDFPPDMDRVATETNRLDNQILVRTYEKEWGPLQ